MVVTGHVHHAASSYSSDGTNGCVRCVAPALFTRKNSELGYSLVSIDTQRSEVTVKYRQKTEGHNFVAGTLFAENDNAVRIFPLIANSAFEPKSKSKTSTLSTGELLMAEFNEASTSYSSKEPVWVGRDISLVSETSSERHSATKIDCLELALDLRNCIIRAPREFGLSSLGKFIALKAYTESCSSKVVVFCDASAIPAHRKGVSESIASRCVDLATTPSEVAAFVLDNWATTQYSSKLLKIFRSEFPGKPLIILEGFDDFHHIINAISADDAEEFQIFYLWSLTRGRVRELVTLYLNRCDLELDESIVTKRLLEDFDVLNLHRSPVNCLLLLKLLERAFDDSPVNRTEVIGKVFYFLFHEFDQIPRYSARPDLKDCEHALGYIAEWMIRDGRRSFLMFEFMEKVSAYCKLQLINVDVSVLFTFLATENIFIKRGNHFSFRLTYWLYYFAAHRMHHDSAFANYILSERRYAAFPEIIEFYTGIDRRRSDAIVILTADLAQMDEDFLKRSGIVETFDPFAKALWTPSEESIHRMEQGVLESIKESALPSSVKDTLADKGYDNAKPYHQEVADFLVQSSLRQMEQAMRGASRALRNSDYVPPEAKAELLDAVVRCWTRMCQTLVMLSPMLSANRSAKFDGLNFLLDKSFDHLSSRKDVWSALMDAILENVVDWYSADIYSKKLGPLLEQYLNAKKGTLGELLLLLLIIKRRPSGWEDVVRSFILRTHKNSYYLAKVRVVLWSEFRISFATERARQELRNLGAMCVAKHSGAKKPSGVIIEKVAAILEDREKSKDRTKKQ